MSRLGDGIFWYATIALLPVVYGRAALPSTINMVVAGAVGVIIYKILKTATARPRPFAINPQIQRETRTLDEFSFPSGHSLHSASLTIIATNSFPELGWLLVPFAGLVAMSRIVLGLHYPSDVLVGLLMGSLLGFACVTA